MDAQFTIKAKGLHDDDLTRLRRELEDLCDTWQGVELQE